MKKKPELKKCKHPKWKFKQTKTGVRRKCTKCGLTITEVASGVFGGNAIHKSKTGERLL
jgi:hypothetical protein